MVEHGVRWAAGKWGRAVNDVEEMPTAQEKPDIETIEVCSPTVNVINAESNDNIVDLYSVGHEEVNRTMCNIGTEVPFQHTLRLLGPQGEVVRVSALFDGCAMVSVMCTTVFEKIKHRLGHWSKSMRRLRMGNGVIVPSLATWQGRMQLGSATVEGEFEVFDSGGSWGFLLGKPTLRLFHAIQAYGPDTVSIQGSNDQAETLTNEIRKPRAVGDKPG